jgi:hypothetical protein
VISFPQKIADAYVLPARNVAFPSTPGRQVRFLSGHAVIKDGRDLVAMMRREGVRIFITPYASSWVETWLAAAGTGIKAEVQWSESEPATATSNETEVKWDPEYREDRAATGT